MKFSSKPTALVIAHPFEGRVAYFLAGLSHFYQLDLFFVTGGTFKKKSQIFYQWHFAPDTIFLQFASADEILKTHKRYDATFFHAEAFGLYNNDNSIQHFKGRDEILRFLQNLKQKTARLYFIEQAEFFFFSYNNPEFWDLVDGVIKHHVFKREFAHLVRDECADFKFTGRHLAQNRELIETNRNFMVEKYYHKIFPLPFPPSVIDAPRRIIPLKARLYDIAANVRPQHKLRYAVTELVERTMGSAWLYSFDYGDTYSTNLRHVKNLFNPILTTPWKFTRILSKILYGKYRYPKMLYIHNLRQSRCYLGLGLFYSSYRTADAWNNGTVLLNWNFDKFDYGLPMVDGYNYVSLGDRERISPDNLTLLDHHREAIVDKVQNLLQNPQKQQEIVRNQLEVYREYFDTPRRFVQKIFIDKAHPMENL